MERNYLTSGAFAQLCNTSKETLRHYKNLGLLLPKYSGTNGYQYYEAEQFYEYYGIHLMKMTGTPLTKIKEYLKKKDIPSILDLLEEQRLEILERKNEIEKMQFVVENSIQSMRLGIKYEYESLTPRIAYFTEEHLLAVPYYEFIRSINGETKDDVVLMAVLQTFKEICEQNKIQTDYQLGAIRPQKIHEISHLYVRINGFSESSFYRSKPAGSYLYVVQKGNWDSKEAFSVLERFEEQGIVTFDDIYAYDLAGFMVNGIEKNSMTIVSTRVSEATHTI